MVDDLEDLCMKDMPQYDPFVIEPQNFETFPSRWRTTGNPRVGGIAIFKWRNTTPKRGQDTRGHVVHQKCDAESNPIGRTNLNEVESPVGEIKLTANIIAELMCAQ